MILESTVAMQRYPVLNDILENAVIKLFFESLMTGANGFGGVYHEKTLNIYFGFQVVINHHGEPMVYEKIAVSTDEKDPDLLKVAKHDTDEGAIVIRDPRNN